LSLKDAFAKAGIYPKINPGEVWKAKDSSVSLLGALTRHWHNERYCLILSNSTMCNDPNWPLVLIAPLSHILQPKALPDLYVQKTDKNGLQVKSRLILSQIQPLLKTDLQEHVGEIEVTEWEEIMRYIFWHIDRE
jgi:mRNA-degrading endonuclease toxin of MazEF toxin-antitoxin module